VASVPDEPSPVKRTRSRPLLIIGDPPCHTRPDGILSERKERTRLGLSRFTAEAAEQAAEHRDKLGIAGKVKDVASVHRTLWPDEPKTNEILPGSGILIGTMNVIDARTGEVDSGPDKGKFIDLETGEIVSEQREEKRKELPSFRARS
jgi:hypothetical protein